MEDLRVDVSYENKRNEKLTALWYIGDNWLGVWQSAINTNRLKSIEMKWLELLVYITFYTKFVDLLEHNGVINFFDSFCEVVIDNVCIAPSSRMSIISLCYSSNWLGRQDLPDLNPFWLSLNRDWLLMCLTMWGGFFKQLDQGG